MSHLLPNFTPGPLDIYRKKASFNWKKLKILLESEEIIEYQNELYKELQDQPDFQKKLMSSTFDEERHINSRRAFVYQTINLLSLESTLEDLRRPVVALRTSIQLSPSSYIKFSVGNGLFNASLRSMGTERHVELLERSAEGTIFGCYCLTEIGHGTNTKGMRTTATYDKENKTFIVNSPDFEAAKCWAGGLGQTATHAIVYCQLVVDGIERGLHAFVIAIRDPKTLLPYPGVIVGDMGEKIGLNGIDNGFVMFDQYVVPRVALLNKLADVTEDGRYVTPFKDPNKRHGAALGALSSGRVTITAICEALGIKALTIAIRYAAVRKQFGPEGEDEIPILEYQSHQHRLLPYLAAGYVLRVFTNFLVPVQYQFSIDSILGNNKELLPDMGMEIHAVSCASKPMAGWIMKEAIQECREACGGHGYLKVAGIGDIRNDHDANLTYEGENHVLIQQTSNWLLKMWPLVLKRESISTPFHSADFLSNGLHILTNTKFTARSHEEICRPETIMSMFQWLVCYLMKQTRDKIENDTKLGKSNFWAKNDCQVFYAKSLAKVFIQHFFLQKFLEKINEATDNDIRSVLLRLFSLFGLWSLEKYLATFYQGGLIAGSEPTTLIQEGILRLCAELKDDAVALIDVVAPPDFILNSALGASDGMVYKRLQAAMFSSPYAMGRPKWWQDIVNWKTNVIRNKL